MPSMNSLDLYTLSHRSSHSLLSLYGDTMINITDNIGLWYSDVGRDKVRCRLKACGALMTAV